MPVTLTIPDDVALQIMSQMVSQMADRRAPQTTASTAEQAYSRGLVQTREKVEGMKPGEILHVSTFASKIDCPSIAVSNTMKRMRDEGWLKMVRRGTWQRVEHAGLKLTA